MAKAPKFHVTIHGLPKVKKALKALGAKGPKALGGALFREGEGIMGDSKEKYVPVDLGNLKSSGHVQHPKITSNGASVELGFGGPAAPYALAVHENPRSGKTGGVSPSGAQYKTWSKVGQWKYLETPYKEHLKGMDNRIAADLRKKLPETK
jgi:hypothetical protein